LDVLVAYQIAESKAQRRRRFGFSNLVRD